jgi:lysyl endopeptidase
LIVGQLTGGSSSCSATNQPDIYGKMWSNWDQNGTTNASRLRPWLDPINVNVITLAGTNMPCSQPPVAQFIANQTNVLPGTTVNFTDQSSNTPTSWTWTISPSSGWSFAGGTSGSSQNPQVTFLEIGQYTISLTVSNPQGNSTETKVNYIVVANSVPYCAASSLNLPNCEEFISNVTLGSINNTTSCSNYSDFTAQNATLMKGQQYTVFVNPRIVGNSASSIAYTDDEVAVWIDFNNDGVFDNPGERVGYLLITNSYNQQPIPFSFIVPSSAISGTVRMRCRISYRPTDGNISPCGVSNWGEVEDYSINILESSPSEGPGLNIDYELISSLMIYPNPSTGEFYIDATQLGLDNFSAQVFDVQGSLLREEQFNADAVKLLNLSNLAKGVYNIRLISGDYVVVRRIVIQ